MIITRDGPFSTRPAFAQLSRAGYHNCLDTCRPLVVRHDQGAATGASRQIACRHLPDETEEELLILVGAGATVKDVSVEHPVYGELTAGIAHEINQPLTAIAAYADAGRSLSGGSDDALRRELVTIFERIGGQSRRAAEVVRRLRKMVRGGTVQKARHDINQIISNVLLLFEHELNNLDIEIDFDPIEPACELYVDDVQIQQVLVNLVKNSLDALVDADNDNGLIRIRLQRAGSEFLISVSDNGPGIDKELRKRLFEAFFTTKKKGVGLGLSICKSIATAHGGTLHYSRPREGGSRFTLSLPLEAIG